MSQRLLAYPTARLVTKATIVLVVWTVIAFFIWPTSFFPSGGLHSQWNTTTSDGSPVFPTFYNHGASKCLPPVSAHLLHQSREWSSSCQRFAPFKQSSTRIATLTMSTGKIEKIYHDVLENFMLRSIVQEDDFHVLCDPLADGIWNKIAFLLKIMLEQMLLPAEDRYEWLFWIDRDIYIIDHCRPVETFLPPERASFSGDINQWVLEHDDKDDDKNSDGQAGNTSSIHMLAQYDTWGLNAGVFLLRVHPWSIALLEEILAWRFYKPTINLDFAEQSVMERLLDHPKFARHVAYVPSHWFNAYTGGEPSDFLNRKDQNLRDFQARRGDFLLHFAGHPKKNESMARWVNELDRLGNVWERGDAQRVLEGEIEWFWRECGGNGGLGSGEEQCGTRFPEGKAKSAFGEDNTKDG